MPDKKDPPTEPTGAVTSDSLAATSLRSPTGTFAGTTDPTPGILPQTSRGSTLATSDTSAATTLAPAPDAETRDAESGWAETGALRAADELRGKEDGVGPTYNVPSTGGRAGEGTSGGGGGQETRVAGGRKAAGEEAGSDGGAGAGAGDFGGGKQASLGAGAHAQVGEPGDPASKGVEDILRANAVPGIEGGEGPRQKGLAGGTEYDALKREEGA